MKKDFVFYSTQKSREKQQISLLAIFETIVLVIATWSIAWHFDNYAHIYTAIVVAPLLLLKTPQSIKHAIRWFLFEIKFKDNILKDYSFWFLLLITLVFAFTLNYFITNAFLVELSGRSLFWNSFLMDVVVVGAVAVGAVAVGAVGVGVAVGVAVGAVAVGVAVGALGLKVVVGVVVGLVAGVVGGVVGGAIGLALGLLLRSIAVKFLITFWHLLRHPIRTINQIPTNYREQLLVNDCYYSPELLPEIHKQTSHFHLSGLFKDFVNLNLLEKIIGITVSLIWLLAYLYRLSIKSTAWFYWPLVFLANLKILSDSNNQKNTEAIFSWKPILFINAIFLFLFLYYVGISVGPEWLTQLLSYELLQKLLLELSLIWLMALASLLAIALYFYYDFVEHKAKKGTEPLADSYAKGVHWLSRLCTVCWLVFLIYNAVIFFDSSGTFEQFLNYLATVR